MASLLGGVGGLVGGLVGAKNASGDFQNANEAMQKGAQQLINTGMPPELAKQVVLQQYKAAGILTPELEQAFNLGPSAVANLQEDPSTRNAQLSALQQYQQAGQTGQTAQDQLNNQKMLNQVNADNQSRQQSIIQGAQMRGESGSGASLAAQLANAQGSANNESNQGLQLAAQANQARMAALSNAAGLGGQLRSQDFNVAQTKANAADQFQRFNVQNQQAVANQNVNVKNQAQAQNLANAQQLSNANVGQNNQEAERQNQAQLTDWQNQNQRNSLINQGYNQSAGNYQNQGNAVANQAQQFGAGLGGAIGAGASMAMGIPSLPGGNGFGGAKGTAAPTGAGTAVSGGESAYSNDSYSPFSSAPEMVAAYGGIAQKAPSFLPPHLHHSSILRFDEGGMVPQQQPQQQSFQQQSPMQQPGTPQQYMQNMPQQKFMPASGVLNASSGAMVPGHATAQGDSYQNDKIHALLSPDEIVLPRSITTRSDAPERAMEFVKGILAAKKHQR